MIVPDCKTNLNTLLREIKFLTIVNMINVLLFINYNAVIYNLPFKI